MKQSKVLVIYFKHTISEEVATNLTVAVDIVGLESNQISIKKFVQSPYLIDYQFIIGLGQYSGKDKKELRLETTCNKKWRNSLLLDMKITKIKPFLYETAQLRYAKGHGNSYCNFLSLLTINTHPNKLYNFIHIPEDFDPHKATTELDTQISLMMHSCA
jgi:hypothetical protein